MNATPISALLAGLLCAPLPAQTYVVDERGGGQFTDLPQAIAAVPDGAVLRVKPGTYSAFTIANKGVTIVGDSPAVVTVAMNADVQIGPTTSSQRVVLRDLHFAPAVPPFFPLVRGIHCADARGTVLCENVVVGAISGGGFVTEFVVRRCDDVHLLGCDLGSRTTTPHGPVARLVVESSSVELSRTQVRGYSGQLNEGFPASDAVRAGVGSRLMVVDSTIRGGDGGNALPPRNSRSYPGGAGLVLSDSAAHLYGASVVAGGDGGGGYLGMPQYPPAAGGDGILLHASTARILGFVPTGGRSGGAPAPSGRPIAASGGSTYEWSAAPALVAADVTGTQAPAQTIALSLNTHAGAPVVLVLDTRAAFTVALPVKLGARCVGLSLVLGPFVVPPSGALQVPTTLPPVGPLDAYVFGQWFVLDPQRNELQGSNLFTLLMKS